MKTLAVRNKAEDEMEYLRRVAEHFRGKGILMIEKHNEAKKFVQSLKEKANPKD